MDEASRVEDELHHLKSARLSAGVVAWEAGTLAQKADARVVPVEREEAKMEELIVPFEDATSEREG